MDYGSDGELTAAEYDALGRMRGFIEVAVDAALADPGRKPAIPIDARERERLLRTHSFRGSHKSTQTQKS
jgi:hypothetical protein